MKGYGIEIKNNLLEAKHFDNMGISVWLYMWLIDHITAINDKEIGLVLGGKPVKLEEIQRDLPISPDTYTRWIEKLAEYPYIETDRTPYGIVFRVFKAFKRFRRSADTDSVEVRSLHRISAESNKTASPVDSNSKTERGETPSQTVKNFFLDPEPTIKTLIEKGFNETMTRSEIKKFMAYWTELNKSGTKQRWEMQPTFEVNRRLSTWFSRLKEFNQNSNIIVIS